MRKFCGSVPVAAADRCIGSITLCFCYGAGDQRVDLSLDSLQSSRNLDDIVEVQVEHSHEFFERTSLEKPPVGPPYPVDKHARPAAWSGTLARDLETFPSETQIDDLFIVGTTFPSCNVWPHLVAAAPAGYS